MTVVVVIVAVVTAVGVTAPEARVAAVMVLHLESIRCRTQGLVTEMEMRLATETEMLPQPAAGMVAGMVAATVVGQPVESVAAATATRSTHPR